LSWAGRLDQEYHPVRAAQLE
jgi:hypothetical protein